MRVENSTNWPRSYITMRKSPKKVKLSSGVLAIIQQSKTSLENLEVEVSKIQTLASSIQSVGKKEDDDRRDVDPESKRREVELENDRLRDENPRLGDELTATKSHLCTVNSHREAHLGRLGRKLPLSKMVNNDEVEG